MEDGKQRYISQLVIAKDGETAASLEGDIVAFKEWANERGFTLVDCTTVAADERQAREEINWGGGHYLNGKAEEVTETPMGAGTGL